MHHKTKPWPLKFSDLPNSVNILTATMTKVNENWMCVATELWKVVLLLFRRRCTYFRCLIFRLHSFIRFYFIMQFQPNFCQKLCMWNVCQIYYVNLVWLNEPIQTPHAIFGFKLMDKRLNFNGNIHCHKTLN